MCASDVFLAPPPPPDTHVSRSDFLFVSHRARKCNISARDRVRNLCYLLRAQLINGALKSEPPPLQALGACRARSASDDYTSASGGPPTNQALTRKKAIDPHRKESNKLIWPSRGCKLVPVFFDVIQLKRLHKKRRNVLEN